MQTVMNYSGDKRKSSWIMLVGVVLVLVILAIFAYLDLAGYMPTKWLKPFPQPLNDNITYILILVGAIAAAVMGTLLTNQFDKGEPPHRIWLFFTVGWWCWVLGELLGFVYRYLYQKPPQLTLEDLCWTAGYIFFGLALYQQYRLIYRRDRKSGAYSYYIIVGIVLILAFGLTQLALHAGLGEGDSWLSLYSGIFYPICDLAQGLAALWLSFLFGRGLWGRPWWGLIAFTVADGMQTWYRIVSPKFPILADSLYSTIQDTFYIGGYFIVALACLSSYLVIKSGLSMISRKPIALSNPGSNQASK